MDQRAESHENLCRKHQRSQIPLWSILQTVSHGARGSSDLPVLAESELFKRCSCDLDTT